MKADEMEVATTEEEESAKREKEREEDDLYEENYWAWRASLDDEES